MNRGLWLWSRVWRLCPQWTAVVPGEPDKGTGFKRPRDWNAAWREMELWRWDPLGPLRTAKLRFWRDAPDVPSLRQSPLTALRLRDSTSSCDLSTSSFTHSHILLPVAISFRCIICDTIPAFLVFDRHLCGSTSLLFECCGGPHLGLYSAIYTFESTG